MRMIFLFVLMFYFLGCNSQNETEILMKEESLSSFVLRNYDGSRLKWKLIAKNARISDTTIINQLELEFFSENLNQSSVLKADSGYIIHKTNDLKAIGNIIIKSSDSVTLWTDELNWSEEKQKIFTDGEVKYSRGNEIYRGIGLESDPSLKHIVIKQKFSGEGEFK
jgi:LPS export ABC transporter protein LptC